MEPSWGVGEKVYINGTGHMTKMAAKLIYDKNLQKSYRPRYQVSVYMTIGPLVDRMFFIFADNKDNYKVSDEFKIQPDLTMDCGVSCF